jgi:hypothetical protein
MRDELRELREAKRFLDGIFNSPFSGWRWPGYLSVEQIMVRLGFHRHSVYKLIHKHLAPRGGVYRRGWAVRGRGGRLLVTQETFEDNIKERDRCPRRNKLVTSTRWTRSGPRPVPPRPRPPRPPALEGR